MRRVCSSTPVTTGANHAGVKLFSGYSLRGSVAGVIRFRDGAVGGAILWDEVCPNGIVNFKFATPMSTPNGVYVELVSGTFTEGSLING